MAIPISKGGKGSSGLAEVTVTSNKIRVVFVDGGQVIDVLKEDAPDYIVSGRQQVTLSPDNNKIYNARPCGGSHMAEFIGFASSDANPPTPRRVDARSGISKAGKKYNIDAHLEFTVLFRITRGTWKGYQIANNLFYCFLPYDGDITQISGAGSKKVEEVLEALGIDYTTDSIPFSENILPYLEKLLLSKKQPLIISLTADGWIDTVVEAPDMGEEPMPVSLDAGIEHMHSEPETDDRGTVEEKKKAKEDKPDVLKTIQKMVEDGVPGAEEMLKNILAAQETNG